MKILITGSRGQLGTALQKVFAEHELICTDYDSLDITSAEKVREIFDLNPFELVINGAAYTAVDKAEEEKEKAFLVNAVGPENLARESRKRSIPIIHISTDYVFDGNLGRAYRESDTPRPCSVYGESKLEGEKAVAGTNPKHYIVRTAWLYSTVGQNFVKTMIALAQKNPELRVVNDQTGSPTYAPHLASLLKDLCLSGSYGIRHAAGSGQATWYELTVYLFKIMGIKIPVIPVTTQEFPRPARRPPFSVLISERKPQFVLPPWEKGLEAFVDDWRSTLSS